VEDLFVQADILTLHAPLAESTWRIVNARTLALMKQSAFLVNTARGGLVDEAALVNAVRQGAIGGAALVVFQEEPPRAQAFAGAPNLILSAHVAALSHESVRRMSIAATSNVLSVLTGDLGSATLAG
jgi:phosphoglycerate dehydrogenase-like enzyme